MKKKMLIKSVKVVELGTSDEPRFRFKRDEDRGVT